MHTHFIFFIFLAGPGPTRHIFFWAGPSSAHMGWARPSQPGQVTGPSQWPGWAEQHACANARVLLHCASELKFTCTVQMLIKRNNARRKGYWLGLLSAFLLRPSSFLLFCEFVLLFLLCLCLLVPSISSLFFFVLLPCFLCWFALFFSWSRPPLSIFFFLRLCLFFVSPRFPACVCLSLCSVYWVFFLCFSRFSFFSCSFFSSSLPPFFFVLSRSMAFVARENNAVSSNHKVW